MVHPIVVWVVTIWSKVNTTATTAAGALMRDATKYIRLFHHEGSTKSITDKKYISDRTRARGMYKNIRSYLTNTFKPT